MTSILQKRNNIIYPVNSLQPFNGISINVQNPFKFEYYGHYPGGQLVSIHSEIGSRLFDPDELFCRLHYENGKCIKQVCYYLERDTELNFFSKAKKTILIYLQMPIILPLERMSPIGTKAFKRQQK